jgi:hypothetical protein
MIFGAVYPADIFAAGSPFVKYAVPTGPHAGIPCGQTANLDPSLTGLSVIIKGASGAVNRRLPIGGCAYGILEKL